MNQIPTNVGTTLTKRIVEALNIASVPYTISTHEPVRTSAEAALVRGSNEAEGAKALIFRADGKPIQIVLQGTRKVDKDKFKANYNINKLKMVSAEEVLEISGVEPGGVPPFGNLFEPEIPVYCDDNLLKLDDIEFNAGDRSVSIRMKSHDWQKVVNPVLGNFTE